MRARTPIGAALVAVVLLMMALPSAIAATPKYDINTLAGKVASLNGTAGLQVRFSAFLEEEAAESEAPPPEPGAPITPGFVLSSPLDGTSIAGPNVGWVVLMVTAFGIAFWKASLVVKEFMHLPLETHFIWYIEGVVVAFMLLFFFAVSPDVMQHEGRNWENRAAMAAVERGKEEGAEKEREEKEGHHNEGEKGGEGAPHEAH